MTTLALVSGDFVQTGGMDMPNFALARHAASRGVGVELVAYRVAPEIADSPGVMWHKVPKPLSSYFLGAPLLDLTGRRIARRVASRGGHVVVNGGNCLFSDVNWVHYVHAAYAPRFSAHGGRGAKNWIARRTAVLRERQALQMSRLVITNSDITRRHVIELLGVPRQRTVTVYYGIDPSRFYPATEAEKQAARAVLGWPERPHALFVGALGDRRKGFDTVFDAWSCLCRKPDWDADLVVVGQGAELDTWRQRAASIGLTERIRFLGFRHDVPRLMAAGDVLVAPARYEAYGLGVQEALCAGLPAIVSAGAGVAERYPPELRELLIDDPDSAQELAKRLECWAQARSVFTARTRLLSSRLRERTWDVMAQDILNLLAPGMTESSRSGGTS